MRKILQAMAIATLAPVILGSVGVGPAEAARFCSFTGTIKTVDDYAVTAQKTGSSCSQIGARHTYDPVWSNSTFDTPWSYSTGRSVYSQRTAEIVRGGHVGSL